MIQLVLAAALSLGSAADVNRAAIQQAVDEAAAQGGGKVVIPAGIWPTGLIELKSGVELHLEKGATLKGSAKASDYNADDVFPENFHSAGEEWSGGCWKQIRRQADMFAEIGTNTVKVTTTDCKPGPVSKRGVMLLSFDDRNFDGWIAALPLFEKYGAHATFFVSGGVDDTVVRKMKTLTAKGHAIGLHGLEHRNAPEAIGQLGEEGYYAADIEVPKRKCDVAYVEVTSFAYPNCRFNDRSDALFFRKGFAHVRGGIKGLRPYDPNGEKKGTLKPLVTDERMFFPASELPKRRRLDTVLLGEAYNTDIADYLACIRRAAERDEVLVLASHNIAPNARGIHMKTEWLEALLAEAQKCGMKVISYNELPPLEED